MINQKHGTERISASEVDFIDDSKAAIIEKSSAFTSVTLYLLLAIVMAALVWSHYAIISVNTTVFGQVVSTSNLQVVQHLEGGIVKEIHVKEGQEVKANQPLVTLDDTREAANHKRDLARTALLEFEAARLQAEASGEQTLKLDPKLVAEFPTLAENTEKLFHKNTESLNESVRILKHSYGLVEKELKIVAPLAEKGSMSQLERIRLERELNRLRAQVFEKTETQQDEARKELNRVRGDLTLLKENLMATKDRLERTVIRAPASGTVNRLTVSNIGAVIAPGSKIAEIVPKDDMLTVEVKVPTNEIGFISIGQKASVKINTYDYSVYGDLKGTVTFVGTDALEDERGRNFYKVKIATEENYLLNRAGDKLNIRPGMDVTVNIITGERSVMSYLLKPLVDLQNVD